MVVCGECGAENRDRARFCRGCTQPLVAVTVVEEPDTVAEVPGLPPADGGAPRKKSTRPCPACKAPNPRRSLSCLACGEPLGQRRKALNASKAAANDQGAAPEASFSASAPVVPTSSRAAPARLYWKLAAVLLLVGVVVWWYSAFRAQLPSPPVEATTEVRVAPEPQQSTAPSPQTEPLASTVPTLTPAADAVNADGTPAVAQLSQAVEEVRLREERKEAERIAAQEKARAARIAERQRAQEARLQAAREAAAAAAAAAAAPPPPAPVIATPAPAPVAPPPPKTVAQLCAGATNFLARDFCRIEACQQAANVNDAICVSYRRMDAERRARMAN